MSKKLFIVGLALVLSLLPVSVWAYYPPDGITEFDRDEITFEGTTDDAFEATIRLRSDPTADVVVSVPSLTAGVLLISTLTTNDVGTANSVWATSNNIAMEGATANDFETFITPTDATADRTITIPDAGGTLILAPGAVVTLTNVDLDTADNSIAANVCEDLVLTATGIAATDNIAYVMTTSDLAVTFDVTLHTPGTNAITARTCNNSGNAADPGAVADFRIVRINA